MAGRPVSEDRDIALDAIAKLARCRGELYEVLRAVEVAEPISASSIEAVLRETAGEDDWPEWTSEWHTKADDERPHHE